MVCVSDRAVEEFRKILKETYYENLCIKFISSASNCCGSSIKILFVDRGEDEDILLEKDGLKFYFQKEVVENLSDSLIDYDDGFIIQTKTF